MMLVSMFTSGRWFLHSLSALNATLPTNSCKYWWMMCDGAWKLEPHNKAS